MADIFTDALEKAKSQHGLLESFGYKDSSKGNLEKSHIENLFEHDAPSRGFTIDKPGTEIKERLKGLLHQEEHELTLTEAKISGILATIPDNEKPTKPVSEVYYYIVDGWESKLGDLPMMYPWDEVDSPKVVDSCMCSDCQSDKRPEGNAKREYNELVYKYVGTKKEIALLMTMIENFSDDKVYSLTVREATMLGW